MPNTNAVLVIVEGVEDELDRVRLGEVGVALALREDDLARVGVERDHADVQVLSLEDEPHFGLLGGRLALVGILLHEVVNGGTLVQTSSSTRPSIFGASPLEIASRCRLRVGAAAADLRLGDCGMRVRARAVRDGQGQSTRMDAVGSHRIVAESIASAARRREAGRGRGDSWWPGRARPANSAYFFCSTGCTYGFSTRSGSGRTLR